MLIGLLTPMQSLLLSGTVALLLIAAVAGAVYLAAKAGARTGERNEQA